MSQEFENCVINEEEVVDHTKEYPFLNSIVDHEIIQLKNNCILRVFLLWGWNWVRAESIDG